MGQRRQWLAETSVILFLTLFGHVTHAFVLLAPPGTMAGDKTNFTLMDIGKAEDYSLATDDLYQIFTKSKKVDRFSSDDNGITTLDHDTQRPLYETSRQRWVHSYEDGRLHQSLQRHGTNVNIDAGNSNHVHAETPETEPGKQTWKGWEYGDDEGHFPLRFEDEEVKMPEPLLPPRRASRPRKGHRVKRRARASVIVRVPPARSFQSGIQTYIRSPRRSRVDARVGVLVVADYSVYRKYMEANGNNHPVAVARIRRYYGMVFAMMNERFQTIKDPYLSITVTISGILIAQKRTDSPWTEQIVNWANKKYHGRASVDTATSLHDFSQWLNGRGGLPEFDHAMVFTAYRLTDPNGVGLGGMAYLEAVCDTKSGNAVSIVGDKGDFQAVRVATHELAHSLGASHDGERGAESCLSRDAFIMSSMTSHNQHAPLTNAFHFSPCSIRAMAKHLSKSRSSCVTNKPLVYYHYDLERHPPGRIYNADLQCKLIFGTKSMFCGDGTLASVICGQIWCRDPNRDNGCRTNSYLTALPGTPCGKHGMCSKGECVPDKTRYDNNNNNRHSSNKGKNSSGVRSTSRIGNSKSSIVTRGGHSNNNNNKNNKHARVSSNGDTNRNIDINRDKPIHTIRGSRINTSINRNVNIKPNSIIDRDRNINKVEGSSSINKDINVNRNNNVNQDTNTNVNRDRNTKVNRDKKINQNNDMDVRRQSNYTRGRKTNRDSTVKDNRYLRNSSISRVKVTSKDRDTNRQSNYVRGRNSNKDIIVNRDNSRNRARITKKNNDNTNSIRNVQPRPRTNSIPNSQRVVRPSYRMRKLRRNRRHRARQRSRSGSRRAGRKHRKRGKRKHRCKGDKNENYCRGLIELNPGGCRRKAIRQYCCATCKRKRRAKNRVR